MNKENQKAKKQNVISALKGNNFVVVLDNNLNIVAASHDFFDFFKIKSGTLNINLKDFFTIDESQFLKNTNSGKTNISSLDGKKWTVFFNRVIDTKKREFLIANIRDSVVDNGGRGFSEDDLDSIAFLLMGLAHEIKNPLAGIKVLVDMVEAECEGNSNIKKTLSRISKNVDRVNSMLEVFFSYARSGENRKEIFSLETLLDDIKLFEGYRIKREGVNFEIVSDIQGFYLVANKNSVLNIFLNLLNNALDSVLASSKVEKKIVLRVFQTEIPSSFDIRCFSGLNLGRKDLVGIGFKVRDNGVGMDEFEKRHLFNPFFTTKEGGVGLGMSLVAKYVEENCGEIFFNSAKGEGSCFTVILPGVKEF